MTSGLQVVFQYFDDDGDSYLNYEEFNSLQLATGSETVDKATWPQVCEMFGCASDSGFDIAALASGYEGSSPAQLGKDAALVLKLHQAQQGHLEDGEAEEGDSDESGDLEEGVVDPNDQARVDALADHFALDARKR